MLEETSIAAPPNKTTTLEIVSRTGTQLMLGYKGIPNNLPNSYNNYLIVWKNANTVPWSDPISDAYVQVLGNRSQGSQTVDVKLEVGVDYIVGYAVGAKDTSKDTLTWKNVCATGFMPAGSQPEEYEYFSAELSKFKVLANSISLNFKLPAGATPKANGAWIAIWQSDVASYTTPPIGSSAINVETSQGGASINGLQILLDQVYTVALFTSGWKAGTGGVNVQTAMACTATITT